MAPDAGDSVSGRVRASKACERCNRKRVKCDVTETGQPCTRCRRNGVVDCNLTATRRGRYSRDGIKLRVADAKRDDPARDDADPISIRRESVQHDTSTANNESIRLFNGAIRRSNDESTPLSVLGHHEGPSGAEGSPDKSGTTAQSAYRGASWSSMFNDFLDSRQVEKGGVIDKCSLTYLGESFPLSLVLADLQEGDNAQLHHPGPLLEAKSTLGNGQARSHPAHLLPEDMNCLLSKKAFDYPDQALYDSLMSSFLDTFLPLYPIVNREEFVKDHENNNLPWLLLQSCCFVGATFCHESVLHRAGFSGRGRARFTFYRRAKALFDTGYESNKIVILQSVIMLSFWGGTPNTYWNFYSWIGSGVTLAETLGLHRSLRKTNMHRKDAALLRRLWWTLMIRDAFCSSLVGRPFRINTDMGDIEMLTIEDFEDDQLCGLYQIEMAKLSLILRHIVCTRWLPGCIGSSPDMLRTSIDSWRQELHPALDWDAAPPSDSVFTSTLSILHDHHLILAELGSHQSDTLDQQSTIDFAAQRISMVASSLVLRSQTLTVPHETFSGLFLAGVASYTQLRSCQTTVAQLGRSTINNCQMVLRSVHDSWDPSSWVMDLFEKLSAGMPKLFSNGPSGVEQFGGSDFSSMDWFDFTPNSTFDLGIGSPWQSNSMLSALFDFPAEVGNVGQYDNARSNTDFTPV